MFVFLLFVLQYQTASLLLVKWTVHLFIKSHDNQFIWPNVLFCVSGKSKLTIGVLICYFKVELVQKGLVLNSGISRNQTPPAYVCMCLPDCVHGRVRAWLLWAFEWLFLIRRLRSCTVSRQNTLCWCIKVVHKVWLFICWSVPNCRLPEPSPTKQQKNTTTTIKPRLQPGKAAGGCCHSSQRNIPKNPQISLISSFFGSVVSGENWNGNLASTPVKQFGESATLSTNASSETVPTVQLSSRGWLRPTGLLREMRSQRRLCVRAGQGRASVHPGPGDPTRAREEKLEGGGQG